MMKLKPRAVKHTDENVKKDRKVKDEKMSACGVGLLRNVFLITRPHQTTQTLLLNFFLVPVLGNGEFALVKSQN